MSARPTCRLVRRRVLLAVPPVLAALAACGPAPCEQDAGPTGDDPATVLPSEARPRVLSLAEAPYVGASVTACDRLGATMLSHVLAEDPGSNAVVCPAGAGLTLAMLYAGATDLPEAVNRLLGFETHAVYPSGLPAERDTAWSALQQSMQRLDDARALEDFDPEDPPAQPLVHVANRALLVRPEDPEAPGRVRQEYLDAARSWYGAEVMQTDLAHAQASLDAWACWHTAGLVPTSAMSVNEDTRLVLQNAVLLAARWQRPFDAGSTEDRGVFHRADARTSQVPLMRQTGRYTLVSGEGWRALRMACLGTDDGLVVDLVLPDEVVDLAQLPEETWAEASARLESSAGSASEVWLTLPRLDLSSGALDVLEALRRSGVVIGSVPHVGDMLEVSQVAQQVRLKVDEAGTVGAALTEVLVEVGSAPGMQEEPVSFACDRPFVLRVVDRASGVCVIEAAVTDPAAG